MQPESLDILDDFVTDLSAALEIMEVPIEKMTAEGGWGMFEVNFEHDRPLEAVERYFRYKQTFRIVAREHPRLAEHQHRQRDQPARHDEQPARHLAQ